MRNKQKVTGKDPYTLFDISEEMKEIVGELTEAQQEKDSDLIQELTDELIRLIDLHEDKYKATIYVIKNSLAAAEYNQEIANQFQAVATAHKNLAKRLKDRIKYDMEQHGVTKTDAGIFSVRIQRNSVPSLVIDANPEDIPEEFQRIEIDRDEVKYALSIGREIEFAKLEKGTHLRISVKRD